MKVYPHNPILPNDIFVPDAEAHVWADGRIYLYGSFDLQGRMAYCSDRYHVYSSDNMVDWVDHGVSFSMDDIGWAGENKDRLDLYAPDAAYRNGTYYLYYCLSDGRCGVAASASPSGPFKDVGQIAQVDGIDPAVLIDDDGQAYLYWGQFDNVRVAKLKENMIEIEADTITQPLSVAEHEFHEGSSVKKINGRYYYLFTDTHRHGRKATSMGYALSDHPMHGFKYGGVIIDNFGCDPKTWNNHGSMQCFNGQWYIFYHRSTHGSEFSRHVCVEKLTINDDGTIDEVQMTSSGIADAIDAREVIPACWANKLNGNVRIVGDEASKHTLALGEIKPNDTMWFGPIDFNGEKAIVLRMKNELGCRIRISVDDKEVQDAILPPSMIYSDVMIPIEAVNGRHILKLYWYGDFITASLDEIRLNNEFTYEKEYRCTVKESTSTCGSDSIRTVEAADELLKSADKLTAYMKERGFHAYAISFDGGLNLPEYIGTVAYSKQFRLNGSIEYKKLLNDYASSILYYEEMASLVCEFEYMTIHFLYNDKLIRIQCFPNRFVLYYRYHDEELNKEMNEIAERLKQICFDDGQIECGEGSI